MRFSEALECLLEETQPKVRRRAWKNVAWVAMMPSVTIPAGLVNGRSAHLNGSGKDLLCQPYLVSGTPDGLWQPGWLPSQADLLADDWERVVE
jgi:hypothetical protein